MKRKGNIMKRKVTRVEVIDWQIFTDMWMPTMWAMRQQRNHNKLAAIMRKIESMSGIDRPIGDYIDLALTCQQNYFASTTGKGRA